MKSLNGFALPSKCVYGILSKERACTLVLFPCHLEKVGIVTFMFAAIHINLEQALGWVATSPARIRKVGIGLLGRIHGATDHGQVPN
jgi:hypothetical protein